MSIAVYAAPLCKSATITAASKTNKVIRKTNQLAI
jgi:hypothetical protein